MMAPLNVSRSTIAAQSRGSVKVRVQPENAWLLAMAMRFFSSRSVRTWKRSSAPRRSKFHLAELVNLCGHPHRSIYADTVTMPSSAICGCVCRVVPRHSHRLSRNARTLSVGRYRPGRASGGVVRARAFSLIVMSAWT
jgi:hypothetical protein